MKVLISFFLATISLVAEGNTYLIDEFLVNDRIIEGRTTALVKYVYLLNEIENDYVANDNLITSQELVAIEHNFSDKWQVRGWLASSSRLPHKSLLIHDPHMSIWRRIKGSNHPYDIRGDIGFEFSPSISDGDLYKNKNGDQAILKYRFGLGDEFCRLNGTYLVGVKGQESFDQNGKTRDFGMSYFWGAQIGIDHAVYESLSVGALFSGLKNSRSQVAPFFGEDEETSSWDVSYGGHFKYSKGVHAITLGYRFKNESTSFNKFKQSGEQELEQKLIQLSYSFIH